MKVSFKPTKMYIVCLESAEDMASMNISKAKPNLF